MKKGVVLMNLGSPDSTSVKDVRRYLNEFLMDKRVIDKPFLSRMLLVKGIIVPFRASKSAHAYQTIWTESGSPLIALTNELKIALQGQIREPVEIAMRYGVPNPRTAFDNLVKKVPDLEEIILLPLYPHYAMSSYETAAEYAKEVHQKNKYPFRLTIIRPWYNEPSYIEALSESIRPYLQQPFDHLLFSYHGIPERHIHKGDITGRHCLRVTDCCHESSPAHSFCYRHQCIATTELIAEKLNIPKNKYSLAFQSRLGRDAWLKPFTDERLQKLPSEGIKKLLIVCPAFVSDCLETLEEIAIRGKETYMQEGGESFTMIPCLNAHPMWVKTLAGYIQKTVAGDTDLILNTNATAAS